MKNKIMEELAINLSLKDDLVGKETLLHALLSARN